MMGLGALIRPRPASWKKCAETTALHPFLRLFA